MQTKTCKICGAEFETDKVRAVYCSDECRKKAKAAADKAWLDKNKERMKEYRANKKAEKAPGDEVLD